MDDELRGVKGWLLTFIIIIALVSPAWGALQVSRALAENPVIGQFFPAVPKFEWGLVAASALIGWFVAYRLYSVHNWLSVQLAIAGIWIAGLGLNTLEFFGVSYFTGLPSDMLLSATGPAQFIRPVVFGLVWTTYLLKSQRVENTYRGGEEQAQVFE